MTIQELLELAFQAGRTFEQSCQGGTLDELFHCDETLQFLTWLEQHQSEVDQILSDERDSGFETGIFQSQLPTQF